MTYSNWSQYKGMAAIFRRYWSAYGGWKSVLLSPYVALALLLTGISTSFWWNGGWWDTALQIIPNLLGLSLCTYAILSIGIRSEQFRKIKENESILIVVSASFLHFILVQVLALLVSVLTKSIQIAPEVLARICWGIGFFLFMYAITVVIAMVMGIFRLVNWLDSKGSSTLS